MNPIQETLSDRDRRDPDRYAGPAWAIVGKHDRAWPAARFMGRFEQVAARGKRGREREG